MTHRTARIASAALLLLVSACGGSDGDSSDDASDGSDAASETTIADDTTASDDDTAASDDDTAASDDDATASNDDTAASGDDTATPDEASGSSVSIAREGTIVPVFHPVRAQDNTYSILMMVYSNLVKVNSDDEIIADLASSWTVSDDASEFEFNLRDDVTWHDGEPFTADDVVFTAWWGARYPAAHQGFTIAWPLISGAADTEENGADLAGIVAVDDHTVKITLDSPNVEFLRDLADGQNVIVAEHVLADAVADTIEQNPAVTDHPIGTGPYKFVEFRTAEFVELVRNEDYFLGAPNIETVFWKDLPVDQIVAQLETGDLDIGLKLDPKNRSRFESIDGLNVFDTLEWGMNGLYFRVNHPSLDDARVRQAFYYAIDRRTILESVLDGNAELLWNPPGLNFDGLNEYPFDPDQARTLLAEAGFAQDQPLRLVYWRDMPNASALAPIFQQQLADVGIEIELLPLEIDEWDDRVLNPDRKEEWDIDMEFGGSFGRGPDRSSRQYEKCGDVTSHNMYENCELADLFVQGRSTSDEAERDRIYDEVATIINENVDVLWLWQPQIINVLNSAIGGVDLHEFDRDSVMNIYEWTLS